MMMKILLKIQYIFHKNTYHHIHNCIFCHMSPKMQKVFFNSQAEQEAHKSWKKKD